MLLWHVLGYLTLVSQLGGAAWVTRYLVRASRPQQSWRHAVPVPKGVVLALSSGADYVGFV